MSSEVNSESSATEFEEIKLKATRAMVALLGRHIIAQTLNLIGNVLLARLLIPDDFGVYTIVIFVVNSFFLLSDVGLGAALIQKKEDVNDDEIKSAITLQQLLGFIWILVIFFLSPFIVKIYNLNPSAIWLIRVLSLSLVISSLRNVSVSLLERNLLFPKLALIEISEALMFNVIAVVLALNGFKVWSFIIATLARTITGIIFLKITGSLTIGYKLNWDYVKRLINFGLPFQLYVIICFIKDSDVPIFSGLLLGTEATGLLKWAWITALYPIPFVGIISRIIFPSVSRLEGDINKTNIALNKSIHLLTAVISPVCISMIVLAEPFIKIIFTDKWLPAINVFRLVCFGVIFASYFSVIQNVFFALGKTKIALYITISYTIINWIFFITGIKLWGIVGAGIGNISTTMVVTIMYVIFAKRIVNLRFFNAVSIPLTNAIIVGVIIYIFNQYIFEIKNLTELISISCSAVILFAILELLIDTPFVNEVISIIKKQAEAVKI